MSVALVPELSVADWRVSLAFYRDILGFSVLWAREDEGFAYLDRDGAQIMLDQIGLGRDFDAGSGPRLWPAGRGMNLQIRVADVSVLLAALSDVRLVLPLEERWYRVGDGEVGNRQFIVADPDGYLLRFYQDLGTRV